jgi:hypothetical protein
MVPKYVPGRKLWFLGRIQLSVYYLEKNMRSPIHVRVANDGIFEILTEA